DQGQRGKGDRRQNVLHNRLLRGSAKHSRIGVAAKHYRWSGTSGFGVLLALFLARNPRHLSTWKVSELKRKGENSKRRTLPRTNEIRNDVIQRRGLKDA